MILQNITTTRLALLASLLVAGLALAACSDSTPQRDTQELRGETMGTSYQVTLVANLADPGWDWPLSQEVVQAQLDQRLRDINQWMSTYIDDSTLMRFNRASQGQWQTLPEPLIEVLGISQRVSERSDGAFDITVAPLVNLWGFGPQAQPEQVPDDETLLARLENLGFQHLQLDGNRARRLRDISLDLSGVAKGYGVDYLSRWLEQQGYRNYLVEIGGEVRLSGVSPRGDAWRIGVEQPSLLQREGRKTLELSDSAMATSGNYRNYYESDGKRYSHTIDPRTGRPIEHNLVSVTVLADTAAEADAWATAINVLGPEAGMVVAKREKLPVYMVVREGESYTDRYSDAFKPYW